MLSLCVSLDCCLEFWSKMSSTATPHREGFWNQECEDILSRSVDWDGKILVTLYISPNFHKRCSKCAYAWAYSAFGLKTSIVGEISLLLKIFNLWKVHCPLRRAACDSCFIPSLVWKCSFWSLSTKSDSCFDTYGDVDRKYPWHSALEPPEPHVMWK